VEVHVSSGLEVRADPRLMHSVLQNLLGNAWKFTSHTNMARIEVGRCGDGQSVFFVRDNGAGFDMEHADKLLGVFRRLHREEESPDTGIGLATVERIVANHGGQVSAEAEPGKGATFCFTLAASG
jgi:light-regulated signal transduction histidine kinase (bacteriophytochrome)